MPQFLHLCQMGAVTAFCVVDSIHKVLPVGYVLQFVVDNQFVIVKYNYKNNKQTCVFLLCISYFIFIINPLMVRVAGAPLMISQPVSSILPVLRCPLGLHGLQACPFPVAVFPHLILSALSSSPSLCLARLFWPDLMNRRRDHTTAVCISLQ